MTDTGPTTRPFAWGQIAKDYPEFYEWSRSQTQISTAGPLTTELYNQLKTAYGEHLQSLVPPPV